MPKLNIYVIASICTLLIMISACNNEVKTEEEKSLKSIEWILGTWKDEYNNNEIIEVWNKKSNNSFSGHSYYIIDGDTNHIEELRLEIIDNEIYYAADVPHNKEIVSFLLISEKKNEALFENKNHDFPSRIQYIFQAPDNLHAKISGEINNERKEDHFYYKKIPN